MSYDIGTYIDISHVNKNLPANQKKSGSETIQTVYAIGTKFAFKITPDGFKTALQIPVAFA